MGSMSMLSVTKLELEISELYLLKHFENAHNKYHLRYVRY